MKIDQSMIAKRNVLGIATPDSVFNIDCRQTLNGTDKTLNNAQVPSIAVTVRRYRVWWPVRRNSTHMPTNSNVRLTASVRTSKSPGP